MFNKKLLKYVSLFYKLNHSPGIVNCVRNFHISSMNYEEKNEKKKQETAIAHRDVFEEVKSKNKNTYLEMVKIFVNRNHVYRRGHVEFIHTALQHMEAFGVHKDLQSYKALVDILPKGKFIPTNIIQAEFMHYPKQQQCIINLLEQMEENGVMPDSEMGHLLLNIFGKLGFPTRRFYRMMYWMPKIKNLSPWPVPDPLPRDILELAKYAIERISSADVNSVLTVYQSVDIKDSIDDTWIVSAQSKDQKRLLTEYNVEEPIYVEGAFKVWIKGNVINYFILRGKPKPFVDEDIDIDDVSNIKFNIFNLRPPIGKLVKMMTPSVHEQEDGLIFSVCATGTSTKDSLLSWIRHLEIDGNPNLAKTPIVFTLRMGTKEVENVGSEDSEEKENSKIEDK